MLQKRQIPLNPIVSKSDAEKNSRIVSNLVDLNLEESEDAWQSW